ncbi:unnamed protein product [Gordionus sp. m RMFG-2023]
MWEDIDKTLQGTQRDKRRIKEDYSEKQLKKERSKLNERWRSGKVGKILYGQEPSVEKWIRGDKWEEWYEDKINRKEINEKGTEIKGRYRDKRN